jgi:hypothetical protein
MFYATIESPPTLNTPPAIIAPAPVVKHKHHFKHLLHKHTKVVCDTPTIVKSVTKAPGDKK